MHIAQVALHVRSNIILGFSRVVHRAWREHASDDRCYAKTCACVVPMNASDAGGVESDEDEVESMAIWLRQTRSSPRRSSVAFPLRGLRALRRERG